MRCWDGVWWRAPSCRESPETCIPFITGGRGWASDIMAMRAVAHSMPLAIAVGLTFDDYVSWAHSVNVLFYYWEPDSSFLGMSPSSLVFPAHDPGRLRLSATRSPAVGWLDCRRL
mmetsp:Transcript_33608/g.78149  ORF Transcript_33608/g.78149 Transcript_33608/m.78149 type:complete len:115 (+) Transcript_33608:246-590(+)